MTLAFRVFSVERWALTDDMMAFQQTTRRARSSFTLVCLYSSTISCSSTSRMETLLVVCCSMSSDSRTSCPPATMGYSGFSVPQYSQMPCAKSGTERVHPRHRVWSRLRLYIA